MRIDTVSLTNFCQHPQRSDELGPGVIGIIGPNGAGKSNYVKAILRALTGSSGNPGRKEEDVSWGQDKGVVEVGFTVNGHSGSVRRQLASSSCLLKYGEETVRTAREVDRKMESLIGVDKHVLTDMVFVQQGAIEGILFQRPSERAKALQNLFGTASAEALRGLLLDEINHTHIESRSEPIDRLEKMIGDADARLAEIDARIAAYPPADVTNIERLRRNITEYRARLQATENLREVEKRFAASREELSGIHSQLSKQTSDRDIMKRVVDDARSDYEASQKRVQAEQTFQYKLSRRAELLQEKADLEAALKQPEPQCDVDKEKLDELRAHCEELRASVNASHKIIGLAGALGSEKAVCPTCDQPITEAHVDSHKLKLASEEPQLGMYDKDVQTREAEIESHRVAHFNWCASQYNAKKDAQRVEEGLKALGEIKEADADISKDVSLINDFQKAEKLLQEAEVALSGLQARFDQLDSQQDQFMGQINDLRKQAGEEPLPDIAKLEEELRSLEETREAISRLHGEKVELERNRTVNKQQLEIYHQEEAALSQLKGWRELMERVRMVLHRDQLPNIVAQAYLGALNKKLAEYLAIFESPFMAQLKTDISIECQFPGGHIAAAERLSGGQKVMLGIAFRFAIYDLFAENLGFMVLDEPTVYLDTDHVESVFTLLERVKSYSATAGLQLIIPTHEARLAGVLDKVIRLGLPAAV